MVIMYKDRGIIKWAPFDSLAGLNDKIKDMIRNRLKRDRPVLSSDQLEYLDTTLEKAITSNLELNIHYYEDGFIKTLYGYVRKIDPIHRKLHLKNRIALNLDDIIYLDLDV